MPVSTQTQIEAAYSIAGINGMQMDERHLAEDIASLAAVWPVEEDFLAAINSTCNAIRQLVEGAVDASHLIYSLEGWNAFHFQRVRRQRTRADMRIVFRQNGSEIQVLAFGHRSLPDSVYYVAAQRQN